MNILKEADSLIHGDRNNSYGSYERESERIAKGWSLILGIEVKPEQVPLMMIWLKVSREAFRHKQDNLVDIAGYAGLAAELWEEPDVDDPEEYHITPAEWKAMQERISASAAKVRAAVDRIQERDEVRRQVDDGPSAADYYDVCGPNCGCKSAYEGQDIPTGFDPIDRCSSDYQAVEGGKPWRCELPTGHEGEHFANTISGKKLTWPQDYARAT